MLERDKQANLLFNFVLPSLPLIINHTLARAGKGVYTTAQPFSIYHVDYVNSKTGTTMQVRDPADLLTAIPPGFVFTQLVSVIARMKAYPPRTLFDLIVATPTRDGCVKCLELDFNEKGSITRGTLRDSSLNHPYALTTKFVPYTVTTMCSPEAFRPLQQSLLDLTARAAQVVLSQN